MQLSQSLSLNSYNRFNKSEAGTKVS